MAFVYLDLTCQSFTVSRSLAGTWLDQKPQQPTLNFGCY